MSYKAAIKLWVISSLFSTIAIIVVNYTIDPFQQYRKAMFHKTIFMKEFYLNAGLVKNYQFDSIIVGTSMVQNFKLDEVDSILQYHKAIKLPISGGKIVEQMTVLNFALRKRAIKNVLVG